MARLASLAVDLQANTAKFRSGMEQAAGVMSKFRSGLGLLRDLSIVTGLNLGNLMSAARRGAQAITNIVNEQRPMINAAIDTAAKFGMTTEALQGLRHAAGEAGASAEELDAALLPMLRNIEKLALGAGGPAAKSLERLGLNAKALAALPLDQRFLVLADAMAEIPTQAERVLHTVNILGKGASNLANTLAVGSDGIKELMEDANKLGKVFSSVEAQQVANMNVALARFGKAIDGLKTQVTIQLTPFIEEAALAFNRFTTEGVHIREMFEENAPAVIDFVSNFASIVSVLDTCITAFRLFFSGLKEIFMAIEFTTAAVGAKVFGSNGFFGAWKDGISVAWDELEKKQEDLKNKFANKQDSDLIAKRVRNSLMGVIERSRARAQQAVGDQTELGALVEAARSRKVAAEQAVADLLEEQNKKLREQAGLSKKFRVGPFALWRGDARFGTQAPSEDMQAARTEVRESRVALAQLVQQQKQTQLLGDVSRSLKDPWRNPFAFGGARAS